MLIDGLSFRGSGLSWRTNGVRGCHAGSSPSAHTLGHGMLKLRRWPRKIFLAVWLVVTIFCVLTHAPSGCYILIAVSILAWFFGDYTASFWPKAFAQSIERDKNNEIANRLRKGIAFLNGSDSYEAYTEESTRGSAFVARLAAVLLIVFAFCNAWVAMKT